MEGVRIVHIVAIWGQRVGERLAYEKEFTLI